MSDKKILLVDDSMTALYVEEMILGSRYRLVKASNGEDAVQKALAEPPDLILLDVIMPELDGYEVCRRLRTEEATREVPIIMVTLQGEAHHVERGYEVGCTDYVTKPHSVELLSKVHSYLGAA